MTTSPEVESLAFGSDCVLCGVEDARDHHECLKVRIDEPNPELLKIECHVAHANAVVVRVCHEIMPFELKVEQRVPDIVQACEGDIVNLIDPLFIHGLAGEDAEVAENELNHDVEDVLVEHEENGVAIATVRLTSMKEQDVFQEMELANGEVSRACCLHALASCNSHANMRLADHVTVIGAITNGQHALQRVSHSHESDNIALLLGTNTATNNDVHVIG